MRTRSRRRPEVTLDRFTRLLALEEKRGYDNRAATAGTDSVVLAWLAAACDRARTPLSGARLGALAAAWKDYREACVMRRTQVVAATRAFLATLAPNEPQGASAVAGLPGIGQARAFALAGLGILTIEDLLLFAPSRYVDCSRVARVGELRDGVTATLDVQLVSAPRRFRGSKASRVEALAADGTGEVILVWFNQPYRQDQLGRGDRVKVLGRPSVRKGRIFFVVSKTLAHTRSQEVLAPQPAAWQAAQGLLAEYATPAGLPSRILRNAVATALSEASGTLPPIVPPEVAARHGLLTRPEVFRALHKPRDLAEAEKAAQSLAFERLLVLQVRLLLHRNQTLREAKHSRIAVTGLAQRIEKLSGLQLTGAQRRVIAEIEEDLRSSRPACRLIHGDVGCGKTLVAAAALLAAAEAGRQAAMMAPTETLAEQHFLRLTSLLKAADVQVFLLTGSLPEADRGGALEAAVSGRPGVWVGTHALIQERLAFSDLAVVVVDEQHRFGVAQRARLAAKGYAPNFFAMSATPIPRTLALALYADFDLSVIDGLPPGRRPVETRVVGPRNRPAAYAALRAAVEAGRQAFVVCPLIEASQVLQAEAASQLIEELSHGPLAGVRLGLVHGRMGTQDRQAIMAAFYRGDVAVLVSTTVIEVGLDVPNASVILVENAERFGLAQLHQLRGRVARSHHYPLCILVKGTSGEEANKRLATLAESQDGFRIAEADLKLRGAGELVGLRQHGVGDWVIGDVVRYPGLLAAAHDEARAILSADPNLVEERHKPLAQAAAGLGELEERGWAL